MISSKISVAMATYNGELYLEKQLDSLALQTRLPDELVVSDDGSVDGTLKVINLFSRRAPFPVKVVRNNGKRGYTSNFNTALINTSGDWVFLCDQDDYWFPNKIFFMTEILASKPATMMLMNDAEITDGNLVGRGVTKLRQVKSAGYPSSTFIMGCCSVVSRKLLDVCLPIPESFRGHDNWLALFAECFGEKHVVPTVLQYYRRHGSNESNFLANRTTPISRFDRFVDMICRLPEVRKDDGLIVQLSQKKIFLHRLSELLNDKSDRQLEAMYCQILKDISLLKARIHIKERNVFFRLALAFMFLVSRKYNKGERLSSFGRDVIG